MKPAPIAIALAAFAFGGWYLHDRFGSRYEMSPPTTAPDDNAVRFADTFQPRWQ